MVTTPILDLGRETRGSCLQSSHLLSSGSLTNQRGLCHCLDLLQHPPVLRAQLKLVSLPNHLLTGLEPYSQARRMLPPKSSFISRWWLCVCHGDRKVNILPLPEKARPSTLQIIRPLKIPPKSDISKSYRICFQLLVSMSHLLELSIFLPPVHSYSAKQPEAPLGEGMWTIYGIYCNDLVRSVFQEPGFAFGQWALGPKTS